MYSEGGMVCKVGKDECIEREGWSVRWSVR